MSISNQNSTPLYYKGIILANAGMAATVVVPALVQGVAQVTSWITKGRVGTRTLAALNSPLTEKRISQWLDKSALVGGISVAGGTIYALHNSSKLGSSKKGL